MAKINKYLQEALSRRASDIHFASGEPVRARIDGDLADLNFPVLEFKELQELLFEILNDAEKQKFAANKNLDKSYVFENIGFFRVNIFMTRRGISAVLRAIPQKIPAPADLGLPEAVIKLTEYPKGLVLVTGPTGSGKSTTLAAMIGHINSTCPYHILTAEDPVEFVHESKKSLINQREIGTSCPSFADALKYALREDPDVILVGEMRDLETIGLALTAAETGHLVFGTLHTRGAGASVDRIIDSFPANQQAMIRTMLAESLVAVISQSLLKRADKSGRVAAYEIMIVNHAISNLIREGKTFQISSIIQTGKKDGMILMDQNISDLCERGIVSVEEAMSYMEDTSMLRGKAAAAAASAHAKPTASPAMPAKPAIPPSAPKPMAPPTPPAAAAPIMKPPPVAPPKPVLKEVPKPPAAPPPAAPIVAKPAPPPKPTMPFKPLVALSEDETEVSTGGKQEALTDFSIDDTGLSNIVEVDVIEGTAVTKRPVPPSSSSLPKPPAPPPRKKAG